MDTKNENVFVVFEEYMNNGDIQTQIVGVAKTMERAHVLMTDWALNVREEFLGNFKQDEISVKETPTSIYQNVYYNDYYSFIQIVEKRVTE